MVCIKLITNNLKILLQSAVKLLYFYLIGCNMLKYKNTYILGCVPLVDCITV